MIHREGDYYVCEGEVTTQEIVSYQPHQSNFECTGNLKERIQMIKQRVKTLKIERQNKKPENTFSISTAFPQQAVESQFYSVDLSIPSQLLKLQERVQKIEEKINTNEVDRQTRGNDKNPKFVGTIVERVRRLQKKLQDMVKDKSTEIVNQNINQYSANLQQKEENFKQLYLYDVFTKTQGISEEINILQNYLEGLAKVQRAAQAMPPIQTLITSHNQLIPKRKNIQKRIQQMSQTMRKEYTQLLAEIDAITI